MRSAPSLGLFFCGLLMMASLPIGASSTGDDAPIVTVMRWSGQGTGPDDPSATFIAWLTPILWLQIPYADWPATEKAKLPEVQYSKFWTMVQERNASGRHECDLPPIGEFAQPTLRQRTTPVSATDVAKRYPLVLRGTIVSEQPAWDYRIGTMATITYFRIDEVMKNTSRRALPSHLSFARDYGFARVQNTTLCMSGQVENFAAGGTSRQVSGKEIIVAGRLAKGNSHFLTTSAELVFRVDNGEVLNPSIVQAYSTTPMSLATFRTQVNN